MAQNVDRRLLLWAVALVIEYAGLLSGDLDAACLGELVWSTLHGAAMFRLSGRSTADDDILVEAIATILTRDLMAMINPMEAVLRPRESALDRKPAATQYHGA